MMVVVMTMIVLLVVASTQWKARTHFMCQAGSGEKERERGAEFFFVRCRPNWPSLNWDDDCGKRVARLVCKWWWAFNERKVLVGLLAAEVVLNLGKSVVIKKKNEHVGEIDKKGDLSGKKKKKRKWDRLQPKISSFSEDKHLSAARWKNRQQISWRPLQSSSTHPHRPADRQKEKERVHRQSSAVLSKHGHEMFGNDKLDKMEFTRSTSLHEKRGWVSVWKSNADKENKEETCAG